MSRVLTVHSLRRWLISVSCAGALVGAMFAFAGSPALADEGSAVAGCSCTISGFGGYKCANPMSCTAGFWDCTVNCPD